VNKKEQNVLAKAEHPTIEFPRHFGVVYGTVIYDGAIVCTAEELEDLLIGLREEDQDDDGDINPPTPHDKWGL
jgi:hypothetical protein